MPNGVAKAAAAPCKEPCHLFLIQSQDPLVDRQRVYETIFCGLPSLQSAGREGRKEAG